MNKKMNWMIICLALGICAFPALAQQEDEGVPPGVDLWQTLGGGATYMSFDDAPIPAGFFCEQSKAYTERINFEGVPLKTEPAGVLGTTDTIIERMDYAAYNKMGEARSRLQAVALSLKSREPIETACGTWDVTVGLAKKQPVTEISYQRTDATSGVFNADLVLNVNLKFTLRSDKKVTRSLDRTVHFSKFSQMPFIVFEDDGTEQSKNRTLANTSVDTDADGQVDALLKDYVITIANPVLVGVRSGWVCPSWHVGPPTNPPCIPYAQIHQIPTHAHITLPPCGSQYSGDWCTQGLVTIGTVGTISTGEIGYTSLGQQLKAFFDNGIIYVDPETLVDEMMMKAAEFQEAPAHE